MASSRHGAQPANSQREGMFGAITHTERFAIIITYSAVLYKKGEKYDSLIAIISLVWFGLVWFIYLFIYWVHPTKLSKRRCVFIWKTFHFSFGGHLYLQVHFLLGCKRIWYRYKKKVQYSFLIH